MILLSSKSALFVLSAAAILGAALIAGRSTGKHIEINIVSPEILLPNALSKILGVCYISIQITTGSIKPTMATITRTHDKRWNLSKSQHPSWTG